MHARSLLTGAILAGLPCFVSADPLPTSTQQLIVGLAPAWNSASGTVQCFERTGEGWRAVTTALPAVFGRAGLAWGRGVHPPGLDADPARQKVEGDGRSPAGVFALGAIYGDDPALPAGADFPYHQVTAADAWIEDPTLPNYNRRVTVDLRNPPPWFEKERMRLGDPAYRWLIDVRHNADPPQPGAGSAIFIHIRRGPDRPTVGCTALAEEDLRTIIRWLRVEKRPHYVLLPQAEYAAHREAWRLP